MQSIANVFSSPLQTISQAITHHPKTVIALATLFFAKVVEANTGEAAQKGSLDGVIDWLSKDTGLKVGGFGVVALTGFVLWRLRKGNVEKTPQKLNTAAASTLKKHKERTQGGGGSEGSKGMPRPVRDPAEQTTVLRKPAAAKKKTDGTKIKRVVEFEVPPTPGMVDFDPWQMRAATEKDLRATFTWHRQNGLLCYLLAARMMGEGKFVDANVESKKGHQFVAKSNGDEDVRNQCLLQIQLCKFAEANGGPSNGKRLAGKKREEIIPETPGVVNLSPDQMVNKGIEDLIPLLINYEQYAQLCLLLATDLMLANKYLEAKTIAKKGYYLRAWEDDQVKISSKMVECGKAPRSMAGTKLGKIFEDLMAKCNDLIKVQEQTKAKVKKPVSTKVPESDAGKKAQKGTAGEANKEAPEPDSPPPPPPPPRDEDEEFEEAVMQINRAGAKFTQSVQQEEETIDDGANTNAPNAHPFAEQNSAAPKNVAKQERKQFTGAALFGDKNNSKTTPPAVFPSPSKLPPPPPPPTNGNAAKVVLPANLPPPPSGLPLPKNSAVEPASSKTPPVEEVAVDDKEAQAEAEPKTPADLEKIRSEDAQAESRKKVFTDLKQRKPGLNPVTPPTVARSKKKEAAKTAGFNGAMAQRRGAIGSPAKEGDSGWSDEDE